MKIEDLDNLAVIAAFVLYAIAAGSHLYKGNYAWALVWASYSIANIGLIIASSKN
jgi:hypothetical protein